MEGVRSGRLVVIAHAGWRHGSHDWVCRCDCGNLKSVLGKYIRNGKSKSCGCLTRDMRAEKSERIKREKYEALKARVIKRYAIPD